jgi:hypothetical protein
MKYIKTFENKYSVIDMVGITYDEAGRISKLKDEIRSYLIDNYNSFIVKMFGDPN